MNPGALLKASSFAGAFLIAAGILVAYSPLVNWLGARTGTISRIKPCPAAVVLGLSQFGNGNLDNGSYRRTVLAVQLQHRGLAKYVVLLGNSHEGGIGEAEARASLARDLGVPDADILTDSRGRTTEEEAQVSKQLLFPRGIRSILLVTDSQHMTRAADIFARAGFEVSPAAADEFPLPSPHAGERLEAFGRVATEIMARGYRRLAESRTQ